VALLAALLSTGCRPRVEGLAHAGAFDEAMCAATHYTREADRPRAQESVARILDAAARPRLHLATLSRTELEAAYGEAGRQIATQVVLVRGTAGIEELGIADFGVSVTLVGPTGPIAQEFPSREAIAALTHEALPQPEVEHVRRRRVIVGERFQQRPLMGWAAAALEMSTLFLIPVTEMTGHTRSVGGYDVTSYPTDAEVLASAPVTETLFVAAREQTRVRWDETLGLETTEVWMWPRPADEARADLALEVEWVYATGECAPPGAQLKRTHMLPAYVERHTTIPLPPGPDLEARIAAVFGERVQPLVEL
jgi:hypothetical protein